MVESPKLVVGSGTKLHGVFSGGERGLDDACGIDESVACESVDLHCVPEVRVQQPVYRVHRAQLPVRRNYVRLRRTMRPKPTNAKKQNKNQNYY